LSSAHRATRGDDPEGSFEGQTADTPWNAIHVAYFSGEALWTYLNTPFVYEKIRGRGCPAR
jgi:hypothetical protein